MPGKGGKTFGANVNGEMHVDADATLQNLLQGQYEPHMPVLPVDKPLALAYAIRNLGGHNASAPPVVWEKLDELMVQLLGALASCVGAYY